ncbi:amino acid transporter protein [Klebsormidium nitens]|uniref:Amino acid transporter protein n=1 Tax=Klebsormidium nitens TaxID=105231 RepID=A0A1Y1HPV0_KLENI|nr:amino acid transporter protein [Klebsormidium nitens]|eukprot:GAQ80650.1 amino acid transporter protein [Klebsormidium nitens]
MAGGHSAGGATYGPLTAFMYLFNLVVGTGVLALPSVLIRGGWILGTSFMVIVAFLSYIGVTFIIETMAATNAVLYFKRKALTGHGEVEDSPLLEEEGKNQPFMIVLRTEMGQMADVFFNLTGRTLFYAALIIYLFGDLTIYSTVVPKSMVLFIYGENAPAYAFDVFLFVFVVIIVPFCFFDLQKTKLLQISTIIIRNAALLIMIMLSSRLVIQRGPHTKFIPGASLRALPNLFGGAVYAFMCHHSLPSIITPIKNKAKVTKLVTTAFVAILLLYVCLFVSTCLAYGINVRDPITFNFPPEKYGVVGDFLLLFPVFTLSSSFPIIGITLRNNLDIFASLISSRLTPAPHLHPRKLKSEGEGEGEGEAVPDPQAIDRIPARRVALTMAATLPPIVLSVIAEHSHLQLDSLVGVTGAYAGVAVMSVIPACLVYCSREHLARIHPSVLDHRTVGQAHPLNIHSSPFKSVWWIIGLLVWALVAWTYNTADKVLTL